MRDMRGTMTKLREKPFKGFEKISKIKELLKKIMIISLFGTVGLLRDIGRFVPFIFSQQTGHSIRASIRGA